MKLKDDLILFRFDNSIGVFIFKKSPLLITIRTEIFFGMKSYAIWNLHQDNIELYSLSCGAYGYIHL